MTGAPAPISRRLAVNAVLQGGADVVGKVGTFVLYAVMAREVGLAAFGDFTTAVSLSIIVLIAAMGTDFRVTRLVAVDDDDAGSAFWSALVLKLSLGTVLSAIAIVVAWAGPYDQRVVVATVLLCAAMLADLATMTPQAVFRGFDRVGPVATAVIAYRLVLAVAGVTILTQHGSVELIAALWLICATGAAVYSFAWLRHAGFRPPPGVTRASIRATAVESAGLGVAMVLGAMLSRIDVVILGMLKDSEAVALYGASYRLVEAAQLIAGALALVSFPTLSRLDHSTVPSIADAAGLILKAILLLCAPVAVALTVYSSPIMEGIFGADFATGGDVLRVLGPIVVATGACGMAGYLLTAQRRQRPILIALGGATVVNVAANFILIPDYGAEGAATAMLITMLVMVVLYARPTLETLRGQTVARVAASAALASAAMTALAIVLGQSSVSFLVAGAAFVLVVVAVERVFFPADLHRALVAFRRSAASPG